jgi:multiple sugar transport system permease protein
VFSSGYGSAPGLRCWADGLCLYLAFTKAGEFVGSPTSEGLRRFPVLAGRAARRGLPGDLVGVPDGARRPAGAHRPRVRARWLSATTRFLFYIPGALAGSASVMLWLFLLDPSVSPVSVVLNQFGFTSFIQTVALDNLPIVFTVIAFWTGAGGWIIIMYGALNTISTDVMEAARIDGAGPVKTAWYIQIPLLRKWIAYMAVISLAGGSQLFVEPKILSLASRGVVPKDYSLNQLAYVFAFGPQADFNGSAAISIILLVVAMAARGPSSCSEGGLFERG